MADQIHLKEAGFVFLPIAEGPDGDVFLQQASWSGGGSALDPLFLSGLSQQSINGGRTDGQEFFSDLSIESNFPMFFQYRDELTQEGG